MSIARKCPTVFVRWIFNNGVREFFVWHRVNSGAITACELLNRMHINKLGRQSALHNGMMITFVLRPSTRDFHLCARKNIAFNERRATKEFTFSRIT